MYKLLMLPNRRAVTPRTRLAAALLLASANFACSPRETLEPCTLQVPRPVNNRHALDAIETVVTAQIARGNIPGAVVLVGTDTDIVYLRAFGSRSLQPTTRPMTTDIVFDLASLSKSVGTATAVMKLVDAGKIELHQPAAHYLPEFTGQGKETITVEDLLLHRAGLIADNPMADYAGTQSEIWQAICDLPLRYPPGQGFEYSDVGFIVLGKLVERVSGRPLDAYAAEQTFRFLKMEDAAYHRKSDRPLSPDLIARIAPTEKRDGQWLAGEVHDPRAAKLDGVAGHAGVFSTATDLAKWCQMILNNGRIANARAGDIPSGDTRFLSPQTVHEMTTPRAFPDGKGGTAVRAYGLDVNTRFSPTPRGDRFAPGITFGHTGFTGTSYWIDPANRCFVVILSNRVHPNGKGDAALLRRGVANAVGEAFGIPLQPTTRPTTR